MNLRELALKVTDVVQEAGKHVLQDQLNPHDLGASLVVGNGSTRVTSDTDDTLVRFVENRLRYLGVFDGFWESRPERSEPGNRYWCVGKIDGSINFVRNMSEWSVTVSLFEFNEFGHAQPVLGVVHAPRWGLRMPRPKGRGPSVFAIPRWVTGARRSSPPPRGRSKAPWCATACRISPRNPSAR